METILSGNTPRFWRAGIWSTKNLQPVITRTTAQIAAGLTQAERAEVQSIALDLDELRRENPLAKLPESALRVWLLERLGLIWNFDTGRWEWAEVVTA